MSQTKVQDSFSDSVAKSLCNFNGTGTAAIADSLNISSLEDIGSGNFAINYTNSLLNALYISAGACLGQSDAHAHLATNSQSCSSSRTPFLTIHYNGTSYDVSNATIVTHGDLA